MEGRVVTKRGLWVFFCVFIPCIVAVLTTGLLFWSDTRMVAKIVERNTSIIQDNLKKDEAQETAIVQLREQYIALDKSVSSLSRTMVTSTTEILNAIHESKKGNVKDRNY